MLVLALCLVGPVLGLYEDQAFKFDWRKRLIGKFLNFAGHMEDFTMREGVGKKLILPCYCHFKATKNVSEIRVFMHDICSGKEGYSVAPPPCGPGFT